MVRFMIMNRNNIVIWICKKLSGKKEIIIVDDQFGIRM